MPVSNDLKVTTVILIKGAFVFFCIDIVFIYFLYRIIKPDDLFRLRWRLIVIMLVFFIALFVIVISYLFWEQVYSYVFPSWSRWIIPISYGLLFAVVGYFFWWLSFRLSGNAVVNFCMLGGLWGILTHVLAICRGILTKPPMLQGANPYAAVLIATFEFIFYWCVCLNIAYFSQKAEKFLKLNMHKSKQQKAF